MTTPITSKMMVGAAIVVSWMWLTAGECGDVSITRPPAVQGCGPITFDSDFPTGSTLSLNNPASCPIKLYGFTRIPYAATLDVLPSGNFIYQAGFEMHVVNRTGFTAAEFANAKWSQGTNGRAFVMITGDYRAATGGFDQNNAGYDDVQNRFYVGGGRYTAATVRITYQYGAPGATLAAPSTVALYASYTVSLSTDDPLLVDPLTWSWYVNGVFQGTSTSPEMTFQAGGPNTSQEVRAYGTDINGRTINSAPASVWTQCLDEYGNPVELCY